MKIYFGQFGVLHKHSADVTMSDIRYPMGSTPPQLLVGAFKLHQIRCIGRGVLSLLMSSLVKFYFIRYGDTAVQS